MKREYAFRIHFYCFIGVPLFIIILVTVPIPDDLVWFVPLMVIMALRRLERLVLGESCR